MNCSKTNILIVLLCLSEIVISQTLIPYRKNNKWGYANTKGEIVIKPQFKAASIFMSRITAVKKRNKYAFINRAGELVTPFKFIKVSPFYFNQASVWEKDTAYCINSKGEQTHCMGFCGGAGSWFVEFQTYKKETKMGAYKYDYTTNPITIDSLPAIWDTVIINEFFAAVKKGNKWGVINNNGELITGLIYDSIELKKNLNYRQFFKVKRNNKYGFLSEKGILVIEPKYIKAGFFNYGVSKVWIDKKTWFYIDKTGREYYEN